MTNLQTSTLRPGLLVSLKTSLKGNVSYRRLDLENERNQDGESMARWETERKIADAAEHEAATKARNKAASLIRGVCTASAFGLLCPEDAAENLDAAVADAQRVVNAFNATAQLTRISVFALVGRIAADDVQAVRAINSEVRDLLADMERGLASLDVKVVREAAQKARDLGNMLAPDARARIQIAIEQARAAATKIKAAGEQVACEVDRVTIRRLAEARTAFLDLDGTHDEGVSLPATQGRTLDLSPSVPVASAPVTAPAIEL